MDLDSALANVVAVFPEAKVVEPVERLALCVHCKAVKDRCDNPQCAEREAEHEEAVAAEIEWREMLGE